MNTAPPRDAVYRFAGHTLLTARAEIRGPDGMPIELRPKSYAVLLHLVQNPSRVLTREALLEAVWPGVTVGEEALTQCVSDIRRVLGAAGPTAVRTMPRRGYMLDVPVDLDAADRGSPVEDPHHEPAAPFIRRKQWMRVGAAGAAVAVLIVSAVAWLRTTIPDDAPVAVAQPSSASAPTPREKAIRLTREGVRLSEAERDRASWLRQRELFNRATDADPSYGQAWSQLVFTYTNMVVAGHSLNPAQDTRLAEVAAERALAVSPEHSDAHAALCSVRRIQDRLDEALMACRKAVEINPGAHPARANIGWILVLLGRSTEAEGPIRASIAGAVPEHRLQPVWHHHLGAALLLTGKDEAAAQSFRQGLCCNRTYARHSSMGLIAALALSGQQAEAEHLLAEALGRWPDLTIAQIRDKPHSTHPAFVAQWERLLTGLALAGLR